MGILHITSKVFYSLWGKTPVMVKRRKVILKDANYIFK